MLQVAKGSVRPVQPREPGSRPPASDAEKAAEAEEASIPLVQPLTSLPRATARPLPMRHL